MDNIKITKEELKHINRIFKRLQKWLDRQGGGTAGAAWNDDTQLIFDSCCAIRMNCQIPVPDAVGVEIAKRVEGFVENASNNNGGTLALPKKSELKTIIKQYKAGQSKYRDFPVYDFGEGLPAVNAEYLLDVLTVVGKGATAIAPPRATDGVYFWGANGDAVLMPIRKRTEA